MKNIAKYLLVIILLSIVNFTFSQKKEQITAVEDILNKWHKAAATADFEEYFSYMDEEAIFIGTDPTENWNTKAFKNFSKPYFDKGKAWNFTPFERNIFFSKNKKIAWFDELLDTQMKICRGSGVLEKVRGEWKIKHYVLSIAIPNMHTNEVVKMKEIFDNQLLQKIKVLK